MCFFLVSEFQIQTINNNNKHNQMNKKNNRKKNTSNIDGPKELNPKKNCLTFIMIVKLSVDV